MHYDLKIWQAQYRESQKVRIVFRQKTLEVVMLLRRLFDVRSGMNSVLLLIINAEMTEI